jgi:hypothetical protein
MSRDVNKDGVGVTDISLDLTLNYYFETFLLLRDVNFPRRLPDVNKVSDGLALPLF